MNHNCPAIILENTIARVINLDKYSFFSLRETVLFFDTNGYLMANAWVKKNRKETFKTYLVDENGFFPTGILKRVYSFLLQRNINPIILDNRIRPKINKISFIQKCAEPNAYEDQQNASMALLNACQGIAQVPTGVGKSRIIKDNIQRLGVRSLVIVPSTNLKEQTAQYLEDCFGASMVGVYEKGRDLKPVTVINYHAVPNIDDRAFQDFDLVQFDEFHHSINDTIRHKSLKHLNHFYYRFGLTATNYAPSDSEAILLEAVLSNTVYSMSILEAIQKKYIVPILPVFFEINNSSLKVKDEDDDEKENYAQAFSKFITNNPKVNEKILETIDKMNRLDLPNLTLVKHIEHGNRLAESSGSVFLNGQDSNSKDNIEKVKAFNDLKIKSMVGTSVIGEGVDTKACFAVINGKGGKSKKELLQNIGRCVRNFSTPTRKKEIGFYFDFIHKGHKNLAAHSRERLRIIRSEFGIEPKIIKA